MKRSKLILSFYVGAIALSAASLSFSVAWYATADKARINSIVMTIDGDRELLISTQKDGDYVQHLNNSDLFDPGTLSPVTTAHSEEWLSLKSDTPKFYDETVYSEAEDDSLYRVATSGYFSQKLYLLADDDLWVTINPEDTYIKPSEEFNRIYAQKLYENYQAYGTPEQKALSVNEIIERLNTLVNAMRFSILVKSEEEDIYDYVIIDPNKEGETIFAGALDNNSDLYFDYFTKSSDNNIYERVYGDIGGDLNELVYDEALPQDSELIHVNEDSSAFNAKHKKDVKRFNLEKTLQKGTLDIKKEESIEVSEFNKKDKPFRIPVYRDVPREITLSIYIEGWDLESINHNMGSTFISNISFMVESELFI